MGEPSEEMLKRAGLFIGENGVAIWSKDVRHRLAGALGAAYQAGLEAGYEQCREEAAKAIKDSGIGGSACDCDDVALEAIRSLEWKPKE